MAMQRPAGPVVDTGLCLDPYQPFGAVSSSTKTVGAPSKRTLMAIRCNLVTLVSLLRKFRERRR